MRTTVVFYPGGDNGEVFFTNARSGLGQVVVSARQAAGPPPGARNMFWPRWMEVMR
jgi:hypothetical protein